MKPHGGSAHIGQMLETNQYIDKFLYVNIKMERAHFLKIGIDIGIGIGIEKRLVTVPRINSDFDPDSDSELEMVIPRWLQKS